MPLQPFRWLSRRRSVVAFGAAVATSCDVRATTALMAAFDVTVVCRETFRQGYQAIEASLAFMWSITAWCAWWELNSTISASSSTRTLWPAGQ